VDAEAGTAQEAVADAYIDLKTSSQFKTLQDAYITAFCSAFNLYYLHFASPRHALFFAD
jgi:hypothetical protein